MTEIEDDPNEAWQFDRAMSPKMYLRATNALGLNRVRTARYLGISTRTERRFANGEAEIPPAVVLLLRALLHYRAIPLVPLPPRYAKAKPIQPNTDLT